MESSSTADAARRDGCTRAESGSSDFIEEDTAVVNLEKNMS